MFMYYKGDMKKMRSLYDKKMQEGGIGMSFEQFIKLAKKSGL